MTQSFRCRISIREAPGNAESVWCDANLKAALAFGCLTPLYFLVDPEFVNSWFPLVLGGVCLSILLSLRQIGLSQVMVSPIAWFLLACAVYYGVGPLLYVYGNDASLERAHTYYYVDSLALWRTNLLNIVSIALILLFFSAGMSLPLLRPFKRVGQNATLRRAAHCFAVIGIIFTLLTHGLRSRLGQEFLMPGIFYALEKCSLASLFLYSLLYFRGFRETKVSFVFMVGFVGYFAVTSLMKQNILEFVMVMFLGFFLARPSIKALVMAAGAILIIFPALTMLTTYGRILLWTEGSTQVGMLELIRAWSDTDAIAAIEAANEGSNDVWLRMSYSAPQAFAMDAYDAGKRGHSFESALWAFVPRLIYPDKPVINQGEVFTTLVKGSAIGGGTGAGFFGEAYWNLGWYGVLFMSMFVGMLMAILTQFNRNMVSTGNYQFFPVAFMALSLGYRVDDWLVATTFNSIPLMVSLYLIAKLIILRPLKLRPGAGTTRRRFYRRI